MVGKQNKWLLSELFFIEMCILFAAHSSLAQEWRPLSPLPDKEGFAAPFAGVSHGSLIVAGGANFPEKRPWEGGSKVWYGSIYALDKMDGEWRRVGELPRPIAYGVSCTYEDAVIGCGGSDANRHYADCFRLRVDGERWTYEKLPDMPAPRANACGALVGRAMYVVGGQKSPSSVRAESNVWKLDLANPSQGWKVLPDLPGEGRILGTAVGWDGKLWIFGGASLSADAQGKAHRTYHRQAFVFEPEHGWVSVEALPFPSVAAASPSAYSSSGPMLIGGDDGSQVGKDPKEHSGFSRAVICYNVRTKNWEKLEDAPIGPVTLPVVLWQDRWVMPSGEIRPGIRTPEVWSRALFP